MLGEIIMDAAIQAQQEVVRSRKICDVCNTRFVALIASCASSYNVAGSLDVDKAS